MDVSEAGIANQMIKFTGNKRLQTTPTLYLYGQDKANPTAYKGQYNFDEINLSLGQYCDGIGHTVGLAGAAKEPVAEEGEDAKDGEGVDIEDT